MSTSWIVNVSGRAYGPYSDAQMATFSAEGRLAAQSWIARTGETVFRQAGEEPELAPLFAPTQSLPNPGTPVPRVEPDQTFGRNKDEAIKKSERAHIVVIADMKSRSIDGLEQEMYKLGQVYAVLPQVWLLRTNQSVNAVRNTLVQQLGKLDVLFVVDATNNKAAWFNFGPEADTRIRRIWTRTPDAPIQIRAVG
jgi:hypothetical protein